MSSTTTPTIDLQPQRRCELTVVSGFLGAGKTTILLHLVRQLGILNPSPRVAWLKNEYGINECDSLLAAEVAKQLDQNQSNSSNTDSNLAGISEIINGCICCTAVGKLGDALLELESKYHPDRILIETSGSAFPATLAMELHRLEQLNPRLHLDAVINVIDVVNFMGYEDISYTAKLQCQYTDLILLNKSELVDLKKLDDVVDQINLLNSTTPKIQTDRGSISIDVVFGIESRRVLKDGIDDNNHQHNHHHNHMSAEVHVISWRNETSNRVWNQSDLIEWLDSQASDDVYRIKGKLQLVNDESSEPTTYVLNWAFGRYELHKLSKDIGSQKYQTAVTIMLARTTNPRVYIKNMIRELKLDSSVDSVVEVT